MNPVVSALLAKIPGCHWVPWLIRDAAVNNLNSKMQTLQTPDLSQARDRHKHMKS